MIPEFQPDGNLPPGIHWATWNEFILAFGTTPWRRRLLAGLYAGLSLLKSAGCRTAYIDGSFVTSKADPGDYDACWETAGVTGALLDPVLLIFDQGRALQKAKFLGEFFPASSMANPAGDIFLDFFQVDKHSGAPKGIVAIDVGGIL